MKTLLLILLCASSSVLTAAEESLPTLKTQATQLEQKAAELKDLLQAISQFNPDSMNSSELHEEGENLIAAIVELQKTKALLQERKQAIKNTFENIEREGKIEALKRDIERLEWEMLPLHDDFTGWNPEQTRLAEDLKVVKGLKKFIQKKKMLKHKKQELELLLNNNQ